MSKKELSPEAELEVVWKQLDQAGVPIGNEQRMYDLPERVQTLITVRDYWLRQTDKARSESSSMAVAEFRNILQELHKWKGFWEELTAPVQITMENCANFARHGLKHLGAGYKIESKQATTPDMLSVLKSIYYDAENCLTDEHIRAARAVIVKAEEAR